MLNEIYLLFRKSFPYDSHKDELSLYTKNFLAAGCPSAIYKWLDSKIKQSDIEMAHIIVGIIENISTNIVSH